MGHPLRVAEMIAGFAAPAYVTRQSLHDPKHVAQTTKAVEKALRYQVDGKGYSFVEILANCPTGWRMSAPQANAHMADTVTQVFPLGDLVDRG
jgi:2-oxoglutarate ferredoxin oxidoreductase subunit beta